MDRRAQSTINVESTTTAKSSHAALAATVASVFFGASVVATRYVVPQTTPVILAFLRYAIACICVIAVAGRRAFPAMPRRDRIRVALLGVLFFAIFPWSFSASLTYLPATHVALVVATNPLVTMALSALRGVERISTRRLAGQLLAFTGLAIALPALNTDHGMSTGGDEAWMGYLLVSITVLCGSTYNVLSRPLLLRHPSLAVTSLSMVAGTLALAPLAIAQGLPAHTTTITPSGWMAVLFLATFGGAVGFGLWSYALRRSTPSRVAVFLALNPMTAIALGVLLLDEPFTVRLLLGLVAVTVGIQLATRGPGPTAVADGPVSPVSHRR
jgi:drug/metabolite transporter (DMT)-like permease